MEPPLPGQPEPEAPCCSQHSSEASMYIVVRATVSRIFEDISGRSHLDNLPGSPFTVNEEQCALMGDPLGLLHVVGHDHNRDLLAQLRDRLFDDTR